LPAERERERKREEDKTSEVWLAIYIRIPAPTIAAAATIDSRSVKCWDNGSGDPVRYAGVANERSCGCASRGLLVDVIRTRTARSVPASKVVERVRSAKRTCGRKKREKKGRGKKLIQSDISERQDYSSSMKKKFDITLGATVLLIVLVAAHLED